MQEKLSKFLNSVGYEDKNGDFCQATISQVILNRKEQSFDVFIENDWPISPVATSELLKCGLNGINRKNNKK